MIAVDHQSAACDRIDKASTRPIDEEQLLPRGRAGEEAAGLGQRKELVEERVGAANDPRGRVEQSMGQVVRPLESEEDDLARPRLSLERAAGRDAPGDCEHLLVSRQAHGGGGEV